MPKDREEIEAIKDLLHYPDCWDTIAYPTLLDAIKEMRGRCTNDDCDHKSRVLTDTPKMC